jgi:hypothetical protein
MWLRVILQPRVKVFVQIPKMMMRIDQLDIGMQCHGEVNLFVIS